MRHFIYSIYDVAAHAYLRPFTAPADGVAERIFRDTAQDEKHEIGKHPDHYALFRIGQFDDNTGGVKGEGPECLLTGVQAAAGSDEESPDMEFFRNVSPGGTA